MFQCPINPDETHRTMVLLDTEKLKTMRILRVLTNSGGTIRRTNKWDRTSTESHTSLPAGHVLVARLLAGY